ncbi:MAG: nuclear transport factor 2 family protein [Pseudomonadota bacterium]
MQSHSTLKSCGEVSSVISKIKSTRELYNEAILNRDVDAICSFFTSDYHVITGRGVQSHGIDEQRLRWQEAFSQDPVMLYRRKTKKVHARRVLQYAEELGTWVGKYTAEPKRVSLVAGVYAAKWQKQTNGLWLIQTEIFTTLRALSP